MFIGREEQLEQLDALWRKNVASLVTCRGRRRIGKSTLIEEFARRSRVKFLKVEGLPPEEGVDNETQLKAFADQLSEQTGREIVQPRDWFAAFAILNECISPKAKTVVLIDEISWMGKVDPAFPAQLKYAWDNRFAKKSKLIVVLCGSVSSWINEKILKSKGFVGRPSLNLIVPELSIGESRAFWSTRKGGAKIATSEIFDVLSITGGVPKYLEEVKSVLSADENIRRMAFIPKSVLASDFDEIFRDVMTGDIGDRADILRVLSRAPANVSELAAALGKERNGHLSDALEELLEAGFVGVDEGVNPETGKPVQEQRYRLKDNYARFYLKYIEPKMSIIQRGGYQFVSLEQLPEWDAVKGLAFENLVLNNFREFLPRLGLERSLVISAAPFRKGTEEKGTGVQVDLLLQTNRCIYVVEVKRRHEIARKVIDEVDEKVSRIRRRPGIAIKTALIYDGHLSKSVEADGYFDAVIDIRDVI